MIWTHQAVTLVICILLAVYALIAFGLWKMLKDKEYVAIFLSAAGVLVTAIIITLLVVSVTQTDAIRRSACRERNESGIVKEHPEWTSEEIRDVLVKVCP